MPALVHAINPEGDLVTSIATEDDTRETALEVESGSAAAPAKPGEPLQIEWTKEFWESVSDDALPEVFRFTPAALAASRAKSGVATARQGKLNPIARQVQPGRTVLVRVDSVPLMMKIFDTAELAQKFIDYEEGRIQRYYPETNADLRTREKQPVVWNEVTARTGTGAKTTHQILS
jgi:hypothetical protein